MEKTESDLSWLEVFLIELIYNILNQSCGNFLIASAVHALEMAVWCLFLSNRQAIVLGGRDLVLELTFFWSDSNSPQLLNKLSETVKPFP